jgi:hypothetical protein
VRPARPQGHGAGWEALEGQHAQIVEWVGKGECGHLTWPHFGRCSSRMLAPLGW